VGEQRVKIYSYYLLAYFVFGGMQLEIKSSLSAAKPEEKRLRGPLFVKQQTAFVYRCNTLALV
jgi:hypothetical protein